MSESDKQAATQTSLRDRVFAMLDELDPTVLGEVIEAAGKKRQEKQRTAVRTLLA